MSKYYDKYGLLVSKPDYPNTEENSFLWSVEEYFFMKKRNIPLEAQIPILRDSLDKMRLGYGLYAQNPLYAESEPQSKSKYMSRDQLMAIMAICKDQGWSDKDDIWQEIKNQRFTYNNVKDGKTRWITPFDLPFYMHCAGSKFKWLFLWLTSLACIVSCLSKKEETSGKLLSFVRSQSMWFTRKICNFIINIRYKNGWKDVAKIYFPFDDYPIVVKAGKVVSE